MGKQSQAFGPRCIFPMCSECTAGFTHMYRSVSKVRMTCATSLKTKSAQPAKQWNKRYDRCITLTDKWTANVGKSFWTCWFVYRINTKSLVSLQELQGFQQMRQNGQFTLSVLISAHFFDIMCTCGVRWRLFPEWPLDILFYFQPFEQANFVLFACMWMDALCVVLNGLSQFNVLNSH